MFMKWYDFFSWWYTHFLGFPIEGGMTIPDIRSWSNRAHMRTNSSLVAFLGTSQISVFTFFCPSFEGWTEFWLPRKLTCCLKINAWKTYFPIEIGPFLGDLFVFEGGLHTVFETTSLVRIIPMSFLGNESTASLPTWKGLRHFLTHLDVPGS